MTEDPVNAEEIIGPEYLRNHLGMGVPYLVVMVFLMIWGTAGNMLIIATILTDKVSSRVHTVKSNSHQLDKVVHTFAKKKPFKSLAGRISILITVLRKLDEIMQGSKTLLMRWSLG